MAEKTTVAFRVDESVKSEWENAAESPEYDSLSHLIRLAVQREITDDEAAPRNAQAAQNPVLEGEALEYLNRIEKATGEIQEEVEALGRESRSEELYDLEQVLLEVLPTAPGTYTPGEPGEPDPPEVGEKPRDVAGRIGGDTSDVTDALQGLEGKTGQVRSSGNYYWRIES